MLSLLLFFCSRSLDFSLTRESYSLSDYRRVRRLSVQPRLFLYCRHSSTLSFRLQFPMDPVSGTFAGFGFSPILLSGSSGIAVSSCSVLAVCPRFLISTCGVFSFFVSYAYFVLRCLVFVLPSFIHTESVHEFALLACCYSRWVFKVGVIISCCIFMSELLFGLCFRCCFQQNPQMFVLNKCVLRLQSRSRFTAIFCFLILLSVFITRGLISLNFITPWSCLQFVLWLQRRSCFTAIFVT